MNPLHLPDGGKKPSAALWRGRGLAFVVHHGIPGCGVTRFCVLVQILLSTRCIDYFLGVGVAILVNIRITDIIRTRNIKSKFFIVNTPHAIDVSSGGIL